MVWFIKGNNIPVTLIRCKPGLK